MQVRLRLRELLKEHKYSAYRLAKESEGRISLSTIYRLKKSGGRLEYYSSELCEAICDVLGITDLNQLFERDKRGKR
jgi:hypothetical protein